MEKFFLNTKYLILNAVFFLFPLLFLTTTREFFITNKLYLLAFGVLVLLLLTSFDLLISKKLSWSSRPLDAAVVLFIGAITLSLIFSSANKVAAFLNPSFGLLIFLSLGILYFFLSRSKILPSRIYHLGSIILSLFAIVFFFQPFKNVNLPPSWLFLKNPGFTPLGNQIDLAVFLGFFLILNILSGKKLSRIYHLGSIILPSFALLLILYSFSKNPPLLPPFSFSWYSVLEVMKNVRTAIFGAGIDGFSQLFTRVKDLTYNQSPLWSIGSFNVSRNAIFHIVAETGLLGLLSFVFLIFVALKTTLIKTSSDKQSIWLFVYLLICLFLVPPSLPLFFLLFVVLAEVAHEEKHEKKETDLSDFPFLYYGLFLLIAVAVAGAGYSLGRTYAAEYYFKRAADGVVNQSAIEVYDNMKKARVLNPYEEKYVLNFAQTNLLIADSLSRREADKITEVDRQTIAQAVQAAISEAKELVRLNPNKAESYENLANIYRNIIPVANGADVWAISSYQRAIILDPANPTYRLSLGGIYYLLGKYPDAIKLFEQTATLKSDWPNAYYNLAWAYFQNQEYDKAAAAMQNVVNLIDKKVSPSDWEKANKDLNDFKNRLVTSQEQATESGELNLPKQSGNELNPKLKLPPEASPEAR